MIVKAMNLQY